ncbi:MAG: hypothetical protein JSU06_02535 [Actinobacteria bacterium]|nr:hypothetical protein [Actinomycetota bacterium]
MPWSAITVHVAHDWLDYAAAFAGIGSLVLAAVAALIAIRSKSDARRSSDAAERTAGAAAATARLTAKLEQRSNEQLQIMRDEHRALMEEQHRRPQIEPVLEMGGPGMHGDLGIAIRSGATNVGTLTAEDVLVLTLVPDGVRIFQLDGTGRVVRPVALGPQREQTLLRKGAQYPSVGFGVAVDVRPGVFQVDTLLVTFPEPGVYEIAARCHHHDIPGGRCWAVAEVVLGDGPTRWKQTKRGHTSSFPD